jgi:N-acetylneuraminate synthase
MNNSSSKIFFVAEISANHLGSIDRAFKLVESASKAGASAVKFQTYTPDTMTLDIDNFKVSNSHTLWGDRNLYGLYKEAMTPWAWHPELFNYAKTLNIIPFSTPFDLTALDFLETLSCPMYKISSLETSDLNLIEAVAKTGKPVIVSTGATEFSEIEELVEVFKSTKNTKLTLLLCTSSYPAEPKDANLNRMSTLKNKFGVDVGLSDHSLGIGVSVAAATLGATVIEKHLTLKRSDGGPDSAFSMEPDEFMTMVHECNAAYSSLGTSSWSIQESEVESRKLRRSLYVVKSVKAGDMVTYENIRSIRPGGGCAPKLLKTFIGKKFTMDISAGTPMDPNLVLND